MPYRLRYRMAAICGLIALVLNVSACGTTKAFLDSTTNFLSSTTPGAFFTEDGLVRQEQKINLFAGVTYEDLRQEAAMGSGQYVTSLAVLYGLHPTKHEAFGQLLQRRHAELFATDQREDNRAHLRMVRVLNDAMAREATLLR